MVPFDFLFLPLAFRMAGSFLNLLEREVPCPVVVKRNDFWLNVNIDTLDGYLNTFKNTFGLGIGKIGLDLQKNSLSPCFENRPFTTLARSCSGEKARFRNLSTKIKFVFFLMSCQIEFYLLNFSP